MEQKSARSSAAGCCRVLQALRPLSSGHRMGALAQGRAGAEECRGRTGVDGAQVTQREEPGPEPSGAHSVLLGKLGAGGRLAFGSEEGEEGGGLGRKLERDRQVRFLP